MREQHVGRAGEALGLTQPAVSHALGRLRYLLGDPLFVRHAKGMRPTARADALADVIGPALRMLRTSVRHEDAFDPATAKRTVVIGASDYVDLALMPRLMSRLRHDAPGFDIRLRPTTREMVLQDLRRHEIDLAVGPVSAAPRGTVLTPLFTERLVVISRQNHPGLARKLTLKRFVTFDHLLVSLKGDASGSVDEALGELGLARRIAITVPHFVAAPFIVGASDLVAVMAERVARRLAEAAGISIHELPLLVPSWTVGIARLEDAPSTPAIEWLVALIAEVAGAI